MILVWIIREAFTRNKVILAYAITLCCVPIVYSSLTFTSSLSTQT